MGIRDPAHTPRRHSPEASTEPPSATKGALAHEPGDRRRLLARLRRIEGQVRGLQRMVEEDRYCPEILTQVAAVQASLRAAAEVLLQDHLRHCVTAGLRSGNPEEAEALYAELTDLFKKYAR